MDQNLNSHISTILSVDNQCTESGFDIQQFNSLLKKCAEKISLINFNPALRDSDFLESPRSIEACRIQGIKQRELLIKIQEDVENEPLPQQFMNHKEEFLDLKLVFYERARQRKLDICLETRDKLIQLENQTSLMQKTMTSEQYQTPTKTWVTKDGIKFTSPLVSSLEKEKKSVEELKKHQSKHIGYMIDDQIKQQKSCINTYAKIVKISDLKDEKDIDLDRRREYARQSSVSRELSRTEDSPEKAQARVEKEEKRERSEQKTRAGVERAEILKGEIGIAREIKRRVKEERLANKKEDIQRLKAIEFSVKTMMKAERNDRKQQLAQDKKEERARQTEMMRQEFQKKVRDMAEFSELKEKSKKMGYFERAKIYEEKRKQVAGNRQLSTENRRQKAEEKAASLRKSQERITTEKTEKKRVQILKREKGDIYRENRQDHIIVERINKILNSTEHMDKVKERQKSEEENREAQSQMMLNKMYQSFSRAEEQKKRLLDEGRQRFMIEYLRAEESKEALNRQKMIKEYQKIKFDEKLDEKRSKVSHVASERKALIEEKKELRKEFTRQKSLLTLEFERQRIAMDDELRERTENNSRKLQKSLSTYIQRKDLSFSPPHTDSTSYGTRNRIGTPDKGKSHIAMSKLLKDMEANNKNQYKCFGSNNDLEREYRSANAGGDDSSLNMGTPQKLTQTMQVSGDLSFGGSIKGENESEERTKRTKTPVKNVRAASREKTVQAGKNKVVQPEETLDVQVQNARKKNMRMFIGLLELEMGNDQQLESGLDAAANKIVRYNKGQDEELLALMKRINYMDLKGVM